MYFSSSFHVERDTEFLVKKVWEHENIIEPNCSLVIRLDSAVSIHIETADLERLFGVINAHLEQVHKARKAEVQAERYAEAMFDEYISSDDLFDQDDLKHLDA